MFLSCLLSLRIQLCGAVDTNTCEDHSKRRGILTWRMGYFLGKLPVEEEDLTIYNRIVAIINFYLDTVQSQVGGNQSLTWVIPYSFSLWTCLCGIVLIDVGAPKPLWEASFLGRRSLVKKPRILYKEKQTKYPFESMFSVPQIRSPQHPICKDKEGFRYQRWTKKFIAAAELVSSPLSLKRNVLGLKFSEHKAPPDSAYSLDTERFNFSTWHWRKNRRPFIDKPYMELLKNTVNLMTGPPSTCAEGIRSLIIWIVDNPCCSPIHEISVLP